MSCLGLHIFERHKNHILNKFLTSRSQLRVSTSNYSHYSKIHSAPKSLLLLLSHGNLLSTLQVDLFELNNSIKRGESPENLQGGLERGLFLKCQFIWLSAVSPRVCLCKQSSGQWQDKMCRVTGFLSRGHWSTTKLGNIDHTASHLIWMTPTRLRTEG